MAKKSAVTFTICVSLESAVSAEGPGPQKDSSAWSPEESDPSFEKGMISSVRQLLKQPNRVVAEGKGQLDVPQESASLEWLVEQLERKIVEKMCQVSRWGIDSFMTGQGRNCVGVQNDGGTRPFGAKDLIYSTCLPFSDVDSPQCTDRKGEPPLSPAFEESFTELNQEMVEESLPVTRQVSLGVAFRPTDEELLCLLRERIENGTGHDNIEELPGTLNTIDPDNLEKSSDSCSGDHLTPSAARYFFCVRARAKNGAWSRKTASGWWDQERNPSSFAPGDEVAQKVIFHHKSKGRPWTGLKWQMHEYQTSKHEPRVLCKVMQVADRPRKKSLSGEKRASEPDARASEALSELFPATTKARKLTVKRPRVALRLPVGHSTNLSELVLPPKTEEGAVLLPKEETFSGEEQNFAAQLFDLLSPPPQFGDIAAQLLSSPRADSCGFDREEQAAEGLLESGPRESTESSKETGGCMGTCSMGQLGSSSSQFCMAGGCII